MKFPNFYYEKMVWKKGFEVVAGCDEVGRGSFAGPVICGAVVFPKGININKLVKKYKVKIDDSKKLTDKQRREAVAFIKEFASAWGIGKSTVNEINKYGMNKSVFSAFRRAVSSTSVNSSLRVDYLLIDAFYIPHFRGYTTGRKKGKNGDFIDINAKQHPIKSGDSKSLSIAAASIIAKVYRDDLMINLGNKWEFKKYFWQQNKGYGTKIHRNVLIKHGPTKHHRLKFVEKYITD